MSDAERYGSYHFSSSSSSTACNALPPDGPPGSSDVVVLRRLSTGGDGKGNGRIPKFNAYQYTYHDEELGSIDFSTQARDYLIGPCGGSLLAPFTVSHQRVLTDSYPLPVSVSDLGRRNCFHSFVDKIGKAQQSLQSLVSVGESRETFNMLRHPLRSLVDVTTKYVRSAGTSYRDVRRRPSPKDLAGALNSAYLEWTFGVAPLLSDIKSATKAYYNARDEYTVVKRVSARVTEDSSSTSDDGEVAYFAGFSGRKITDTMNTAKLQYVTYLTSSSPMSPGESPFLRDLGLTASSFVPSVYELIPWSFVLDYFVDIGGYLNREVAISRNWQVTACVSESSVSIRQVSISPGSVGVDPVTNSGYFQQSYNNSPSLFRTSSGSRSIELLGNIANSPVTSNAVHSQLPGWKQSLNLASLGAAFALTNQRHPLTSQQRALFGTN